MENDDVQVKLEQCGITRGALKKALKRGGDSTALGGWHAASFRRLPFSAEAEHVLKVAAASGGPGKEVGWRKVMLEILMDEDTDAKQLLKQMPAVNKWAPVGALSET